jgi:hypothetical protein
MPYTRNAHGRTKADVAVIRHVYLDFDERGTEYVENLLKRSDLPQPNYFLNVLPTNGSSLGRLRAWSKTTRRVSGAA